MPTSSRPTALLVTVRRGRVLPRPPVPHLLLHSVGAALAVACGRGNRRSAAGGGRSEAISRKCQPFGTTVGKRAPPLRTIKPPPRRADRVVRPYRYIGGPAAHRVSCTVLLRGCKAPVAIRILFFNPPLTSQSPPDSTHTGDSAAWRRRSSAAGSDTAAPTG